MRGNAAKEAAQEKAQRTARGGRGVAWECEAQGRSRRCRGAATASRPPCFPASVKEVVTTRARETRKESWTVRGEHCWRATRHAPLRRSLALNEDVSAARDSEAAKANTPCATLQTLKLVRALLCDTRVPYHSTKQAREAAYVHH